MGDAPASFLALGDSYTVGEGVDPFESWPHLLRRALADDGIELEPPVLIARTGWTTDELAEALDEAGLAGPFDLVSLSVGVNNQYRGRPLDDYRSEFGALLARAIALAAGDARHVLVPSIPDWSQSPYARRLGRDRRRTAAELESFNRVMRECAQSAGARCCDITDTTRSDDPAHYADDGLHPSAAVYRQWVQRLAPVAAACLTQS